MYVFPARGQSWDHIFREVTILLLCRRTSRHGCLHIIVLFSALYATRGVGLPFSGPGLKTSGSLTLQLFSGFPTVFLVFCQDFNKQYRSESTSPSGGTHLDSRGL